MSLQKETSERRGFEGLTHGITAHLTRCISTRPARVSEASVSEDEQCGAGGGGVYDEDDDDDDGGDAEDLPRPAIWYNGF